MSLPCKKTRKDSEACIVRDLKARKCLDDFEGVFFIQPVKLSKYNHTSIHLHFIPRKAAYLDHTVTMFFLGDAQEIADSGFETPALQLRAINKHADIKLVKEIS